MQDDERDDAGESDGGLQRTSVDRDQFNDAR